MHAISDGVLWRKNISFKKDTEKSLCYYKIKAWYKLSNSGLKEFCVHLYHAPNTLLRGISLSLNIVHENNCIAQYMERTESLYILPWTITYYHASLIAKAHFKCTILFMISEKKYQEVQVFLWCILKPRVCQNGTHRNCASKFLVLLALKLLSSRIVVFIDMDTYILTECRNFEAFLKENYAIASDSC